MWEIYYLCNDSKRKENLGFDFSLNPVYEKLLVECVVILFYFIFLWDEKLKDISQTVNKSMRNPTAVPKIASHDC